MDPLAKFLGAFALFAAAALSPPESAPFLLAALFAAAILLRAGLAEFAAACAGLVVFVGVFGIAAFGGLEKAALNAGRVAAMMLPFYIFAKTTPVHGIMDAMRRAGVPRDFSFVFSTAMPFSKVVGKQAAAVRVAQQSRGSRDIWSFMVPVFHSIFQKARNLAISIESRGGIGG